MTLTACRCAPARPSAAVNDEIRRLVERTAVWTPEALAALAELRAE